MFDHGEWVAFLAANMMGPSGHHNDAMCSQCNNGNVDCSYCGPGGLGAIAPLQKTACRVRGCCKWTTGHEAASVKLAEGFAAAVGALRASTSAWTQLTHKLNDVVVTAEQGPRTGHGLAQAQRALVTVIYEGVAQRAPPAMAKLIRAHPPPQSCPAVLGWLKDEGIRHILYISSKCAAGDAVANKPGTAHAGLLAALSGLAGGVLVWDIAWRIGPCRREGARGSCKNLNPAELDLGALVHSCILRVMRHIVGPEGEVRSAVCWHQRGLCPTEPFEGPRLTHYRFTLTTHGVGRADGILFMLARARHLIGWARAAIRSSQSGLVKDSTLYEAVLPLLPTKLRDRYPTVEEYEEATRPQWRQSMLPKYAMPHTLDVTPSVQRARQVQATHARNTNFAATEAGQTSRAKSQQAISDHGHFNSQLMAAFP